MGPSHLFPCHSHIFRGSYGSGPKGSHVLGGPWKYHCIEQWKKGPWLVRSYRGLLTTQFYGDYFISHYKDPYKPTRIQWKVRPGFFFVADDWCSRTFLRPEEVTYNSAISSCEDLPWSFGVKFFDEMRDVSWQPWTHTYHGSELNMPRNHLLLSINNDKRWSF